MFRRTIAIGTITLPLLLVGCGSDGSSNSTDDGSAVANAAQAPAGQSGATTPPVVMPAGQVAVAQPDDQGKALVAAIDSATASVDIVIFQIGSQQIQQALVAAMQRGVKVRVMMDGYSTSQVKYNGEFASAMRAAVASAGLPADAFSINWSSDNFNITHQKSVMIDAVDASGNPLPTGSLPGTARLLVSTGNFQDFGSTPFYAARDFYVVTDEQQLINEASRVFASDFSCAGPTETNGLADSTDLIWSNGTTGLYPEQVGQYPPVAQGYFGPGRATDPAPVVQGNSFDAQYALVKQAGAGDVLRIYNEEFTSQSFVDAATAAAQAGADVRIVMSYEQPSDGKPTASMANLQKLAAAVPATSDLPGVSVTLYAPQKVIPAALYVHAKSLLLSDSEGNLKGGFVGSENLSNPSMDYNRELGLPLSSTTAQTAGVIGATFDSDFAASTNTTRLDKANPTNIPAEWNGAGFGTESDRDSADGSTDAMQRLGAPVGRCGPVAGS